MTMMTLTGLPPKRVSLRFASAACTRHSGALATLPSHDLAAYISHNNIFLLTTTTYTVTNLLPIGTAPLNSVKFLLRDDQPHVFASSAEGQITACNLTSKPPFDISISASHPLHDSSCLAFDVVTLPLRSSPIFLASVCDSRLITSLFSNTTADSPKQLARYDLPIRGDCPVFLPHTLALHVHSPESIFLAIGGTERRIHLFNATGEGGLTLLTRIPAHRDWVRSLVFTSNAASEPILASASSDTTVRLFRLHKPDASEPPQPLHLQFDISSSHWSVQSLALLNEHSATVHAVTCWKGPEDEFAQMLTASLDGTLAVWKLSNDRPTCIARFGLLGGHSVHAPGFFSAAFSNTTSSTTVIAANYSGAIHRWAAKKGSIAFSSLPAVGGHFAPVSHFEWSPDGSFFLSASTDKTVRAFADTGDRFVEWARPQVHGHSVFSLGFCTPDGRRYVSGSEERMLRVFDAPESFLLPGQAENANGKSNATAVAATLPELGLSNKAVFVKNDSTASKTDQNKMPDDDEEDGEEEEVDDMSAVAIGSARGDDASPLEEELKQQTLWPETAKLYGHGNEVEQISSHCASHTIASACRSQNPKDAVILAWDSRTGTECARLEAHELSITDLRFSPDGYMLLSTSRDRSVAVFQRGSTKSSERFTFRLVAHVKLAHSRVIYGCTWVNNTVFATGGRDKWLKLYQFTSCESSGIAEEVCKRKFEAGVTALDCINLQHRDGKILAVGLENGNFYILTAQLTSVQKWDLSVLFEGVKSMRCGGRITSMRWRPSVVDRTLPQPVTTTDLGIGSEDNSVRVISFDFNENVTGQPS